MHPNNQENVNPLAIQKDSLQSFWQPKRTVLSQLATFLVIWQQDTVLEDLNPIVAKVNHYDVALTVKTDATGSVQLAGLLTCHAEVFQKRSLLVENLNAVVARICHVNVT